MRKEKLSVDVCEGCEHLVKEEEDGEMLYTCDLWKGLPEPKEEFEKNNGTFSVYQLIALRKYEEWKKANLSKSVNEELKKG